MHCTSITSCHECITPKEWNYPNITRPFSILYYALGGSAFYSMNGVERPFEPGHLYILPANRVFSLREDPDNKFYSVYIHAYTSPEIHSVMDVDGNQDAFLKDVLQLVRKYAKVQSPLHRVYIKNLTELILSHVFETMTDTQERMHVKIKTISKQTISRYSIREICPPSSIIQIPTSPSCFGKNTISPPSNMPSSWL